MRLGKAKKVEDVSDGRRFLGGPFAVRIEGKLRYPPVQGPRSALRTGLRAVVLPDGSKINFERRGNLMAESKKNTLEWGAYPIKVYDNSFLQLVVQFPGGFDSEVNPGEFVLRAVGVDYAR